MSAITTEKAFRKAIDALDKQQQRILAGRFAEQVLPLSSDKRLQSIVAVATDPDSSDEALRNAWKSAKTASVELSARCGADGDWTDQADYFVARAAAAALTPAELSKAGGPAWQAAMYARMAQTCNLIGASDEAVEQVRQQQYQLLSDFLQTEGK